MTIYNINFGIGWASSGVEYAQSYRARLLRNLKLPSKFIFLDFIHSENIQTLTHNLGFADNEIIWLYQFFTDINIAPTTYTIEDVIKTIHAPIIKSETEKKVHRIYFQNNQTFVTCYLKEEGKPFVDRAEFVSNGKLVRKDFYSYVRFLSEYYAPQDNKAKAYMRYYYNEDGSVAYEEYLGEREEDNVYMVNNTPLFGKTEFIAYFLKALKLSSSDILILDRATNIGQIVMENKGDSKVGVVVHAEHFSKNATDDLYILWNNFYEYQFKQAHEIDFFITATEKQKNLLLEQFKHYNDVHPNIYAIPVGSIDTLTYPMNQRKRYSVITASRLANEKHVDWIVRSIIKAKKLLPELTLDIYGEGAEKAKIQEIITQHSAQHYIRLCGHVNLDKIYSNYELFVTASQSEGFGLTLLEAISSGLGMVGFNVNYGNTTFIKNGENGLLLPESLSKASEVVITDALAEQIVKFFSMDLQAVEKFSYEMAKPFMSNAIERKWEELIQEVYND